MAYYLVIVFFCLSFAFAAWKRQSAALFFITALLPAYLIRFQIFSIPFTLLEAMILILAFVSLLSGKVDFKRIYHDKFFWPIVLIVAVATLAATVSPAGFKAWGAWKAYFIEPIIFYWLMLSLIKERKQLETIFWSLGFSALYVSIFAVWQKFSGFGVPEGFLNLAGGVDRVVGFFGYPNALGLFLGPIIVVYLGFLFYHSPDSPISLLSKKWRFILKLSVISLSFLAMILAKSEGAILAVSAMAWLLLFANKKSRIYALFLGAICIMIVFAVPQLRELAYVKLLLQDASGWVRRTMWGETWQLLKDNWLWGGGLSNFQEAIKSYYFSTYPLVPYPHTIVFNLWTELGLAGLLAFIWLGWRFVCLNARNIFKIVSGYSQKLPFDKILSFVLLLVLGEMIVHGLVDAPYFKNDLSVLFWIIFGAASLNCSLKESGGSDCWDFSRKN